MSERLSLHRDGPVARLRMTRAAVQRQVELLLGAGPVASASAKTLVRDVVAHGDGAKHDTDNAALIARLRVSPEGQEGLSAFLDKRKPHWIQS